MSVNLYTPYMTSYEQSIQTKHIVCFNKSHKFQYFQVSSRSGKRRREISVSFPLQSKRIFMKTRYVIYLIVNDFAVPFAEAWSNGNFFLF